jgi:hypothetical protein
MTFYIGRRAPICPIRAPTGSNTGINSCFIPTKYGFMNMIRAVLMIILAAFRKDHSRGAVKYGTQTGRG